jgi:hypothetical protein
VIIPLVSLGESLIVAAAAGGLATAFLLRTRMPGVLVAAVLTLAGVGLGWGGMLVQADPSTGEFVVAVAMLAFLVPAHVRIVLGPFGPRK